MVEAFIPDSVKTLLVGLIAIAFALGWLGRRLPHVTWLQLFRLPTIQMSEAERARKRRSANRLAALEIMLLGLILPFLYVLSTVMMFNNFETVPTIIVGASSVLCFAAGIWILVRNV